MLVNPIGEQLIDLSKKILSIGIKAFIAGKRLRPSYWNYDPDFNQLRDKVFQINTLNNLQNINNTERYIYMNQIFMEQEKNLKIMVHFISTNGLQKDLFVYPDTTIQQLNNLFKMMLFIQIMIIVLFTMLQ